MEKDRSLLNHPLCLSKSPIGEGTKVNTDPEEEDLYAKPLCAKYKISLPLSLEQKEFTETLLILVSGGLLVPHY